MLQFIEAVLLTSTGFKYPELSKMHLPRGALGSFKELIPLTSC